MAARLREAKRTPFNSILCIINIEFITSPVQQTVNHQHRRVTTVDLFGSELVQCGFLYANPLEPFEWFTVEKSLRIHFKPFDFWSWLICIIVIVKKPFSLNPNLFELVTNR